MTPRIALVGNPNAGKTTLFNALTGSSQRVGNYPGVTVERITATLELPSGKVEVADVPGLYSVHARSEDEKVAVDALSGAGGELAPDLLVCVISAANLERNLFLFTQLATMEKPMLVALTLTDQLRAQGSEVDISKLSGFLGVEVIPVVAHKGKGLALLREAIARNLEHPHLASRDAGRWDALEDKVDVVHERFARQGLDSSRHLIREAIQGKDGLAETLTNLPELQKVLEEAMQSARDEGLGMEREFTDRYRWTAQVAKQVLRPVDVPKKDLTRRIDAVLTHRVGGLAIFLSVMYLVFQSIYTLAAPMMDGIGWVFSRLGDRLGALLEPWPTAKSMVVDGLLAGLGAAIQFLPQILILFFFIAVLEGSGYLARAAFLMDRLLSWCGLNGRAFIPLLSSFACAVPGIMAARVLPDPRSRLATILVAPLMSCSARLPVYVLLIGAFIEPRFGPAAAGFALFGMHMLGLLVAIPVVFVLNRGILKGRRLPFVLELPPYQMPRLRDVWLTMYFRGKVFLKTAGTMIVVMSVILWALAYFPRSETADQRYRSEYSNMPHTVSAEAYVSRRRLEDSYLGQAGRAVAPVFAPAGFDWRLTTSILSAFPAREVVVSSLGVMFASGSEDEGKLTDALARATWPDGRPLMTTWTSIGLMAFFALCAQCMATLAAAKRETNSWKWPIFMFCYMSGLAWIFAVAIYQIGRLAGG